MLFIIHFQNRPQAQAVLKTTKEQIIPLPKLLGTQNYTEILLLCLETSTTLIQKSNRIAHQKNQ